MEMFDLVGPNRALSVFGIKLVGFTAINAGKALLTLFLLVFFLLLSYLLRADLPGCLRELKDRLSREILASFEINKIGITSATIDVRITVKACFC